MVNNLLNFLYVIANTFPIFSGTFTCPDDSAVYIFHLQGILALK